MNAAAVALLASKAAATIIRDSQSGTLNVRHKGVVDLVTQVDLAAERVIRSVLAEHTPNIPVLAEEGGGATDCTTRWIVDPLDGTTNFVHGYPSYAVSIALEVEGELTVACVFDAVNGVAYTAEKGGGAWCGEQRLQVSDTPELVEALLATGFPYDRRENVDRYLRYVRAFLLAGQGLRRAGAAAMDFVAVAAGRIDGYWEFGLNPWDVAAGVLLVQEAGGVVTDMTGGPLDLGNPRLLCSNGKVHDEMIKILTQLLSSE
jgi:myo-inositol-1(or 4)-monophosphatase